MSLIDFMLAKRQQQLLGPLLLHPDKTYGTAELISLAGGDGASQKQLKKLVDAGVVTSVKVGNQRRLQINRAFPVFAELRAICMKTFGLAWTLKPLLAEVQGIDEAFIFGSIANGTDTEKSDIDIMFISNADLITLYAAADQIEKLVGRRVHVCCYRPGDWYGSEDQIIQNIKGQPRIAVWP